jgi:predicted transcriptional regulator
MDRPIIGSFAALIESQPPSAHSAPSNALELLSLAANRGAATTPVPVSVLLEDSHLRLDRFGEFVENLVKGGFVEKSGEWGREVIKLTDLGRTVAELSTDAPSH